MKRIFVLITLVATLIQVSFAEEKKYEDPRITLDFIRGGNLASRAYKGDPKVRLVAQAANMGFGVSVELRRHLGVYGSFTFCLTSDEDNSLPAFLNDKYKDGEVEMFAKGVCFQAGIESRWDFGRFFAKPKIGIAGVSQPSHGLRTFDVSETNTDVVQYDFKRTGTKWTGAVIPGVNVGYKMPQWGELFIGVEYRCLFSKKSFELTAIDAYTGENLITQRSYKPRNPINLLFGVSFYITRWKK